MHSSEASVQDDAPAVACQLCGAEALEEQRIRLALWEADRLVVVEEVPALVCGGCGERFYDDETAMRLDMLRGTGFPSARAVREMTVDVFRMPELGPRRDV
mgnify:CR=1 FL=1